MEGLFTRSLEGNERLMIIYMDSRGKVSQRAIRVMDIRKEELLVYCFVREKVRTLKKERVLSAFPAKVVNSRAGALAE